MERAEAEKRARSLRDEIERHAYRYYVEDRPELSDEAYDALFYRPAAAFAASLRKDFEEPVILAASTDVGDGVLEVGRGVRRLQTGLLRTYVFFLGAGMAVVALVFLVVR